LDKNQYVICPKYLSMKKQILGLALILLSITGFTQAPSCEQKVEKFLEMTGTLSAGVLYNTYGVIGSIADGFAHEAYDQKTAGELLSSQVRLMDNVIKALKELNDGKFLSGVTDQQYVDTVISILRGLQKQANYVKDYMADKSDAKQTAYDTQRNKNWKEISALMGIEE
jgi:hypothetical protein